MDPALRNWGMVRGGYDTETGELHLGESLLATTENTESKQRQNLLDIHDAKTLFEAVYPFAKKADVVAIECPVGSQNAAAMKAYGIVIGLIACLQVAGLRTVITTPLEGKAVITGKKDAKSNAALNITKKEVIQWVQEHHPDVPLPRYKRHGEMLVNMSDAEHIADAVIALHAAKSRLVL
ncbi:hypothetical protein [Acinetobacter sp. A47]|uniref:hypothetical protein n=1 Tax=Acinetobacter sp. A47 TaxID=1561217 RepID=UPI00126A6DAD|nr:hypothetical protein [Acinetobacter sp. A47]